MLFQIIKNCLSSIFLFLYKLNIFLIKSGVKKVSSYPVFIISVGNLSFGGSGKTPMVEFLAKELVNKKIFPSIVSRGYGRRGFKDVVVSDGKQLLTSVGIAGDEPYMLAKSLPTVPIVVGNKKKAITYTCNCFNIKTIILDDAFQTNYIKKNLEVLLIDVSLNIQSYQLFPAGILREPFRAINRADIIVFTKNNFSSSSKEKIKALVFNALRKPDVLFLDADYIITLKKYCHKNNILLPFTKTIKEPFVAFCGIANPLIFNLEAKKLGQTNVNSLNFSDHHNYTQKDIFLIKSKLKSIKGATILTTKKDLFKISHHFTGCQILILDVTHSINKESQLLEYITQKINQFSS